MKPSKIEKKNARIAAGVTFGVALLILLWLFFGGLKWDRDALAQSSTPEIMDDEPLFIDPELLDLGEENATENDMPAPSPQGEPEPSPEDDPEIIEPGKAEKGPQTPKLNTSTKESDVKAQEPPATEKEKKAATSAVASKFSPKNGASEATSTDSSGAGGSGTGITGKASGRSFISCPKPDVALRNKTVVTVNVVIDAEGKVTEAKASGSADASIRKKCEAAAMQARWSAKKGVNSTRGTITFTITPR